MDKKHVRLATLSFFFLFILAGCQSWKSITKNRDTAQTDLTTLAKEVSSADSAVGEYQHSFPSHYMTDNNVDGLKARAQQDLLNITTADTGWMAQLNAAIEAKDRKKAEEYLGKVKKGMDEIREYTHLILGPPGRPQDGLFAVLRAKTARYDNGDILVRVVSGEQVKDERDLYAEITDAYADAQSHVASTTRFYLCNDVFHTVNFADARLKLAEGVEYLRQANLLRQPGTTAIDKPLVVDWLDRANASFESAKASADGASTANGQAMKAIDRASDKIDDAQDHVNTHSYDRSRAQDQVDTASGYLDDALTYCFSEDFTSAVSKADDAYDEAVRAISTNTEPPPTAIPQPTSVPVIVQEETTTNTTVESNDGELETTNDGEIETTNDGEIEITDDGGL